MNSPHLSVEDDESLTSSVLTFCRAGMPISIVDVSPTSRNSPLFRLWPKKHTEAEPSLRLKEDLLDDTDFKDIPQVWNDSNLPAHQKAHLNQFYHEYFARADALRSYEAQIRQLTSLVTQQRQSISDLEFALSKTHYEPAKESASLFEVDLSPNPSLQGTSRSRSTDSGFDEEELMEQLRRLRTENSSLRQSVEEVLTCIGP
ncbi:hypothetical protein NEOLI_000732 [Neolecta irregularis DAH-3]|uniref:Uncharacterized protein n=1 Tax=Neolecta irregularis (strain DAH-3) TaxID=1198029 RepID=A0A1U7LWQ6_NEOID|nr:hypothetical protein NEOLI_000732 [Neolecta irregularis DAH-3]|eukprot:OLL26941.1 hypothetical protein NEOLI_000732 [Neolecta irregularis DAH-3]